MVFELLEYMTETGEIPFRNWLEGLKDRQTRARIQARLNRVRLGNLGDHKPVGRGVSELRVPFGPGYRIYFGRHKDSIVVLLVAGDKSTQTTDIALAQRYWRDFQRRLK